MFFPFVLCSFIRIFATKEIEKMTLKLRYNAKKIMLLAFLMITAGNAFSSNDLQINDFTFSHLGVTEGLDNQRIFSICQTPSGAIWWASKKGVSRYNGWVIKNYPLNEGMPYAHLGARVIKLATDDSHLYAYDSRSYIFTFDSIQNRFVPLLPQKLNHEGLNDVYPADGNLYLAMYDGVYLLQDTILTQIMKGAFVNKIIPINNHLLFCAREGVFDEKGHQLLPYNIESGYYDDATGKLWLGGYDTGLIIVTMGANGKIVGYDMAPLADGKTQQNPIRQICPYNKDIMLFGIDGQGVYQMPRNGKGQPALLFDANESQHGTLHGNGVYGLLVDNWKNIFIGTYSGGIDIARFTGSTISVYTHIANNPQSLQNNHVNGVLQLSEYLLMGTDNGVSILNTQTGTWQHCIQGTVALNLCKRADGNILVATYGKGIYEIDCNGNIHQHYTVASGLLTDDHVYAVCQDNKKNLWIGSLNGDLLQVSAQGERHHYPIHDVMTIIQLPSGKMAIGTAFGLKLVDPESGDIEELDYAPAGITDVNTFITHLLVNEQELWIGTEGGGVYVWNLRNKTGHQLIRQNGLPSNYVSSLAKGENGCVWIATEEGLAFVSPQDPKKAVGVDYCFGFDREYVRGAVWHLQNDDILFGSTTGAVIIHPKNVQAISHTAKLRLTGVSCKVADVEQFNKDVFDMLADRRLHFSYSQRTFDLNFESVNMRNHFDIAYRYRIDNGEWSHPTTQQFIRFVSMEPGKHVLTLQCVSRTSGITIDQLSLTITICQPWWNSWWMWCIYVFLVLLAFYGAWRVYELHEKYMRLAIVHLRTAEDKPQISLEVEHNSPSLQPEISEEATNDFVDKATSLILEHLSESDFTIDSLCREMAMSRTLFYVKLKSYTGKSPQDFMRIIRLERAAAMLRNGRNVTDAATLTGFDNPKYFSTVFKKYFGVSPSKYQ